MKLKTAIVVQNIRYQAKRLKLFECFAHETHEDLEQELFCEIDRYDESKGSFNTFVARLTERRANNLLEKQLCIKRNINNYVNIEKTEAFEDEVAKRTDVDYMISTLPRKMQKICEQLKYFNLYEVAKMNNISRTTLNTMVRKIRIKLSSIYYKSKKKN
ncbi:sigma-70 RNA polymerase sigma factor region 4 domain-containing protein [Wolbachia endosymbiont of Nomada ferruginata]|uniref:sigma-70 family RNA polymerase sigma factor n=1 Tax=Wolbachia endosymbiont of Nomada ferruginata TaxID=1854761 RepID=UPI0007EEF309|nr:sigma-70 family RNA polymerase sigma factor [Wolbachia endosymbiont of Nomada ferruginata]